MNLSNRSKGIFLILTSSFFFAAMSMLVRLSGDLPILQKALFRNLIALFIAIGTVKRNHIDLTIPNGYFIFVFLRALFGTISLIALFYTIDRINLADANMLNKLGPFFTIVFSHFLLKEQVKPIQVLAVLGALIGSAFIVKPGGNLNSLPALIGVIGGVTAGAAYTCLRKATVGGTPAPTLVIFFSGFSCLLLLPIVIAQFVMPTPTQLLLLILSGLCAAVGQFAITTAYSYAPAREISIFDYSQVIFAAIFGFALFAQIPDTLSIIGYIIVITMALVNYCYTQHLHKQAQTS